MPASYIEPSDSIEAIPHGYAANDKRGIDLRNGTIIIENNFKLLVFFLTGGEKELGKLDKPIPIIRGGTGATTVAGAFKNMQITFDTNGDMKRYQGSVEVYDNKLTIRGQISTNLGFTKMDTGVYRIEGSTNWGTGSKVSYPKDDLGNLLCGATTTPAGAGFDLKVYGLKHENGITVVDTTKPMDIPANSFILLNLITE